MTQTLESLTLFSNQAPVVATIARPAPARETEYLERIEATLAEAEAALATVEATPPSAAPQKNTTLAVSVVIPVFNERDTIVELVRRVQAANRHTEILLVDDYSLDGTRDLLLELAREPDIRIVLHGYNRGKGAALRSAFAEARGDVVLIQDADLEYDPRDYAALLKPLEEGTTRVVYGSRFLANAQQDPSRLHRWGNWLLTALSNRLSGQRLTDMETCYKVFRRELLEKFTLEQDRFGFEPEFTAKLSKAGEKIVEVPIRYNCRGYHEGKKIGLRDGLNALWCIARYGW